MMFDDGTLFKLSETGFRWICGDEYAGQWLKEMAAKKNFNVNIKNSTDQISNVSLQGPRSREILKKFIFTPPTQPSIDELDWFRFTICRIETLQGIPLIISRTGWSSEFGYELFLRDGSKGNLLWEKIMEAGKEYDLQPGHTSSIRRIEGGMLSYHADADINTNPFELGLDRLINLDSKIDFIGKKALVKIKEEGIKRKQVGLELDGDPLNGPNTTFWSINKDSKKIGKVTSAVYSPRLKKNIALAMIDIKFAKLGNKFDVIANEKRLNCLVVEKPFYDPKKKIASC